MAVRQFLLYLSFCVIFVFLKFIQLEAADSPVSVQNLDAECMKCLCDASSQCDRSKKCTDGYCGPFKISKVYWMDAGLVVLTNDSQERDGAFEDCAYDYNCAGQIVTNYLRKYGQDCNKDGVTNCADYAMVNFNGGHQCGQDLKRNEAGQNWTMRFNECVGNAGTIL